MEYLTAGQMAKLNCISEKTLHFYQKKGVLQPHHINEQTGYRYYTYDQCAVLDTVIRLQAIGFSLDEIKEVLNKQDVSFLEAEAARHLKHLERQQEELSISLQVARDLISGCKLYLDRPICDQIQLEILPERQALIFDVKQPASKDERPLCVKWEPIRQAIKQKLTNEGYPISLYRNVGRMMSKENIGQGNFVFDKAFVYVDPSFGSAFEHAQTIPGGQYLTLYSEHCVNIENGNQDIEVKLIERMLNYMDHKGFELNGDYYDDVVAESPAFRYQGRDAFFRLCLPVRRKAAV